MSARVPVKPGEGVKGGLIQPESVYPASSANNRNENIEQNVSNVKGAILPDKPSSREGRRTRHKRGSRESLQVNSSCEIDLWLE